jgi:alanine racemase
VRHTEAPAHATGIIAIDLATLAANWRALAARVAPAECAAVVKADAYGLGAAKVVPALAAAGCRTFFVATFDEARHVRALAPDAALFVLDGLVGSGADYVKARAVPVLSSLDAVTQWSAHARAHGHRLAAALQLETGLNRLGLEPSEIVALREAPELLKTLDLKLVMSHLACADDPQHPMNEAQRVAFDAARRGVPNARASLAASDGLMLGPAFHYDLVRPGYAIYGGQAFRGGPTPVLPVVRMSARILQVRDVLPGGSVGYSATWTAKSPRRIATIAAGYADGLFRTGSAGDGETGGQAIVRGTRVPFVGRISMDLVTLDITGVPGEPVGRGDWAELIGPGLAIEDVGRNARTIGYEVLTSLSRRFHRVYAGGAG